MRIHNGNAISGILASLAERNIKMERMRQRIDDAVVIEPPPDDRERRFGPYVTVSRFHGAGGTELARRVGAALGWPMLDREVVDLVATNLHLNSDMVELLDENATSWVSDVLSELMPVEVVSRDTYTRQLRRVIQLLGMHGNVVLLGRAAHLFLPRGRGLCVQVVASLEDRIARIRAHNGKDEAAARSEIERADRARARFASRTFDRDVTDPELYDLTLNSSRLPIDALADLVVAAYRRRFPTTRPSSAKPLIVRGEG